MKKLMLLFITMVLASFIANGTDEIKNKGSSQTLNTSNINALIPENTDLTAETTDWLVQQNSSTVNTISRTSVLMNNSQNLMLEYGRKLSTQSSLVANSILEPYRQILGTSVEVQKIPNIAIMNSSNTQRPNNNMVQWRQQFEMSTINSSVSAAAIMFSRGTTMLKIWPTISVNMVTNSTCFDVLNGANVCNVKKVAFYNLLTTTRSSFSRSIMV